MSDNYVLIHYHIFKNAGSSVDASLRHSFGGRWGTFEGPHAHAIQSSEQLSAFMAANKHLVAISSHLARPPLPHSHCLPVVFLRHPLLRAWSVYQYTRANSSQPYSAVAQNLTFSDYIRWALKKEPGSIVIRDYQVVHLSDASWRGGDILKTEATQADLEQACQLLSYWGVVGIVEEFDRSVTAFQARYGEYLPDLEFLPRWDNATSREVVPLAERVDQLRQMLGDCLHDDFMEANRLDSHLYAHGRSLLHA
ncbi:MAG TPA: sulfotransferase family 2 domain-containing protein [Frateuria sp.]|uniref:sulfotransferase family 2 domain-containing protein n=1 Tax=Frateuria sp. TaxID=2211372 RepID=UPI002DE96917|nr:sulfotransferase family 2 domain-containing protein [Frateuria sp.]